MLLLQSVFIRAIEKRWKKYMADTMMVMIFFEKKTVYMKNNL
jgi:hypothetical protein